MDAINITFVCACVHSTFSVSKWNDVKLVGIYHFSNVVRTACGMHKCHTNALTRTHTQDTKTC